MDGLLYKTRIDLNDYIHIVVPKVGDIIDRESQYYSLITAFTAMPIDFMVQLDDAGIDFTQITEFELFVRLFISFQKEDVSMVLSDIDLSKFQPAIREDSGDLVLVDPSTEHVIDKAIHNDIASVLRKIHHLTKNIKTAANDDAKKFMIERARKKMKRRKQDSGSFLESTIVALVNTEEFKYNFETIRDLTIYQFNESIRQVIHKVDYNNRMYGVYAGTVNAKELSQDDLNWLIHK